MLLVIVSRTDPVWLIPPSPATSKRYSISLTRNTNIKVHNIYQVGHGSTGQTGRERNEDYTWVVLVRLQRKDFATAVSANIVFTKSVKWSDTDAVRLCSATNWQNNTSAFVTAADVRCMWFHSEKRHRRLIHFRFCFFLLFP